MSRRDKVARAAYQREWREKNAAYQLEWQQNNKAKCCAYQQKWRENNVDKVKEYKQEYNANNQDKRRESKRKWDAANAERLKQHRAMNKKDAALSHLKRKYGLTEEGFLQMLAAQNNACNICKKPLAATILGKHKSVEHCHKTGRIRGIVCQRCNMFMSFIDQDNFNELLRSARRHAKQTKPIK